METNQNKYKIVAAVATVLLLLSLAGIGFLYHTNDGLQTGINSEKLKSESLLSKSLSLEKEIMKLSDKISGLTSKSIGLDKLLAEANRQISEKEMQIKKLLNQNAADKSAFKKQMEKEKADHSKQLDDKDILIGRLQKQNDELNLSLAALQNENQALNDNVKMLSAYAANNFRIEALKSKKDKLTANAKRTGRIHLGFDLPESLTEEVQFIITTPEGKEFKSGEGDILTVQEVPTSNLTAGSNMVAGFSGKSKRLEMQFKPQQKLSGGIYKIDIYNKNEYLGSSQMKLQ